MKAIPSEQATRHHNSETCVAIEYDFPDEKSINSAVIELDGRYPTKGFAMNEICKELIYVIEGQGTLKSTTRAYELRQGSMALIQPGEQYVFNGQLRLLISSSPAWYPGQYKNQPDGN